MSSTESKISTMMFDAGESSFDTRDDAKRIIKDQLQSNYARIQSGKQDPKFTPLTQDFKQLEVRSGVPKKLTIKDEPDNTFKVTHATATAKGDQANIGLKGKPVATKTHKDLPGVKLTPEEFRKYNSTGMYKGKFTNPEVLKQVERLNETGKWPVDPKTGKPRSLKDFRRELNRGWDQLAVQEANLRSEKTGWVHQRGHGVSADEGGSNWKYNVAAQPATAIEQGGDIGVNNLAPNISQGKKTLKSIDDLEMAGLEGANVSKAFNAYLMEGTEGIQNLSRFKRQQRSRILHDPSITAEGAAIEADLQNRRIANRNEIKAANPVELKQSAKNLFTSISNPRNLARIAGSSNNPIVNMGGDVVGAVMDGVSFVGDPSAETAIDLALSSSQVATNLASMGLAALPIPGARPGAFALMKLGDHISKAERLWNLGGRDMSAANKNQADAIRKDLDLDAVRKRMKIKQ